MPHDGQPRTDAPMITGPLLPDLLALTAAALPAVDALLDRARQVVRARVTVAGRVSATALEADQTAAHGLAWLATYAAALHQMQGWADRLTAEGRFGETETLIQQIAFGEYLWQIYGGIPMSQGEILRPQDMGLSQDDQRLLMVPAVMTLTQAGNTQAARTRLCDLMQERDAEATVGASGLDDEMEMVRAQFRRFAVEKVEPFAHDWHLKDQLIPMEIITELADMGVFGLTIPEEYGGLDLSKTAMAVVSEELSRGYIGVGSLGTRTEIAAELILCGGTEAQKQHWLPRLGQRRDAADRRVHRTEHRVRSGVAAHSRCPRRRGLAGDRQQDVDHPCRPHPCDDAPRPDRTGDE
jgi:(2S)-methylsuccinyl-CoA dehydrogenase